MAVNDDGMWLLWKSPSVQWPRAVLSFHGPASWSPHRVGQIQKEVSPDR